MKRLPHYILLISALTLPFFASGNTIAKTQPVHLTDATIYLKGAELKSQTTVSVPKGESDIILSNIAGNVNPETLSIFADQDVLILSSQFTKDYREKETLTGEIQNIQDQIDLLKDQQTTDIIRLKTNKAALTIIDNSKNLERTKENALSVNEINDLINLVEKKTEQLLTDNAQIESRLTKINDDINHLEQLLEKTKQKGVEPGARIKIRLYAPKATSTKLDITYVVNNAGWIPTYDIHTTSVNQPIELTYKAKLYQNSGIAWDNINIILSSGNPSQNTTIPTLTPWYLSESVSVQYLSDHEMGNEIVFQDMVLPETSIRYDYEAKRQAPIAAPSLQKQKTLEEYVVADNGGINTQYIINIPYTIPSDGKEHTIFIQRAALAAEYQYIAIPKLSSNAYLQATIKDWQSLNLLPGVTSLYFENHYIGQGILKLNDLQQGLNLSLGIEKRIIVEREEVKTQGTSGIFSGNNIERKLGYTIKATNSRPDNIKLTVIDQLPVSQNEQIKIQDLQLGSGIHNIITGNLSWELNLKENESETIEYRYKIRYPKEMNIEGLQSLE